MKITNTYLFTAIINYDFDPADLNLLKGFHDLLSRVTDDIQRTNYNAVILSVALVPRPSKKQTVKSKKPLKKPRTSV